MEVCGMRHAESKRLHSSLPVLERIAVTACGRTPSPSPSYRQNGYIGVGPTASGWLTRRISSGMPCLG